MVNGFVFVSKCLAQAIIGKLKFMQSTNVLGWVDDGYEWINLVTWNLDLATYFMHQIGNNTHFGKDAFISGFLYPLSDRCTFYAS